MRVLSEYLRSSIGKKQLMGLTGLALALFVLAHVAGNMLIFVGPEAYNHYSHLLVSSPLLYPFEAGLVAILLVHLALAIALTRQNRAARDTKYAVQSHGEKGTSLAKRTLFAQGAIILAFTILHLKTFKYGTPYAVEYDGVQMRDLFRLVVEVFHSPGDVAWYVGALFLLGVHLAHGGSSSFQSLGCHHPRYQPIVKKIGWLYAVAVAGGFIAQPIYVYFFL